MGRFFFTLLALGPAAILWCGLIGGQAGGSAQAGDWTTWRGDAARSGSSQAALPKKLSLQWRRQLPQPAPAWPEDPRLLFDEAPSPVVAGQTLVVASARADCVTALETRSGKLRWRFFTGGPVRLTPVIAKQHVYFGSDDGWFYCLRLSDGSLAWKLQAAPGRRQALGNSRLTSVWPVRGGPVIIGDTLYFTVGVWPFEGSLLYKVHLEESPAQPGQLPPFETVTLPEIAPQGHLVAAENSLLIPCGRGEAACFRLEENEFVKLKYSSRGLTDVHVTAQGPWLFHGHRIHDVLANELMPNRLARPVTTDQQAYGTSGDKVVALDLANPKVTRKKDRRGNQVATRSLKTLWELPTEGAEILLKAGDRLYGQQGKRIFALQLKPGQDDPGQDDPGQDDPGQDDPGQGTHLCWSDTLQAAAVSMAAADDRLFVTTRQGELLCYGQGHNSKTPVLGGYRSAAEDWSNNTAAGFSQESAQQQGLGVVLKAAENLSQGSELLPSGGYCLVLGLQQPQLIDHLLALTDYHVIVVTPELATVKQLRERFFQHGLYGTRLTVRQGDPADFPVPPYFASLVITSNQVIGPNQVSVLGQGKPEAEGSLATILRSIRPYGGRAYLPLAAEAQPKLEQAVSRLAKTRPEYSGAKLSRVGRFAMITRPGALPGASNWTHEYSDPANTLVSQDQLVKAPLGVLWFGGEAADSDLFYNRHYWAPSLIVRDGRMYMEGPQVLSCVDIYTGRVLWKRELPKGTSPGRVGNFFERVRVGYHFLAGEDALYISDSDRCRRIDPVTGKDLVTFELPTEQGEKGRWGRMRLWKDLLICEVFKPFKKIGEQKGSGPLVPAEVVAMDRETGEVIWKHKAYQSAPLAAIGNDKVFLFDGRMEGFYDAWKRRGRIPEAESSRSLKALDARTGKVLWEEPTPRVVTWLGFSEEHDVLIASNRKGIEGRQGTTGKVLWQKEATGKGFRGHPENLWDKVILLGDRVIDQRGPGLAYNINTGKATQMTHPISGQKVDWQFTKIGHHCNYAIANPHLVTFRAASAGFLDLESGTTGRLEGFRSGCRNSLIPAGGILNAPNYAHGCVCSYNLFTSLALGNVPEADMWTYAAFRPPEGLIKKVGINLGAPGDRRDEEGVFWLDVPSAGGPSPNVDVQLVGENLQYFRKHSSQLAGQGPQWVAASGVRGLSELSLPVAGDKQTREYTVSLVFFEPEDAKPGDRIFDVQIGQKKVLEDFDVAAAGGAEAPVVKTFEDISVQGDLTVTLIPKKGQTVISGVSVRLQ